MSLYLYILLFIAVPLFAPLQTEEEAADNKESPDEKHDAEKPTPDKTTDVAAHNVIFSSPL